MMFNFEKLLTLVLIQLLVRKARCEIFSAIDELEKLAIREKVIIEQLKVLADQLNDEYIDR